jgi:hypothetical protein
LSHLGWELPGSDLDRVPPRVWNDIMSDHPDNPTEDPFARKKPKPAPRPNALVADGGAPYERALDPYTDDDLHRSR